MALSLSYSVVERNDNKLLTVTDTTLAYVVTTNEGGWNAPNALVTDIDGVLNTLDLDITITTSDGTATVYNTIDLFTQFAPTGFVDVGDLVFPLTCAMLVSGTTALGTADDEFPDGLYTIVYTHNKGMVGAVTSTATSLIDGRVANAVYELLRALPDDYTCGNCHEKETLDIIFMYTYLMSIHASAYSARSTSILNQLAVLETLVTNVSTYTW